MIHVASLLHDDVIDNAGVQCQAMWDLSCVLYQCQAMWDLSCVLYRICCMCTQVSC